MINDGILCIDKPGSMTSNDVVMKVKRTMNIDKIGHTGTLDPEATGVLVLLINKATKALPFLDVKDKIYLATCTIGIKTSTGDIWGETIEHKPIKAIDENVLNQVIQSYQGVYMQKPPMVSAKKKNGKKLYELARKGIEIERELTEQHIFKIELISHTENTFTFRTHVSSGTYIRTLCEDICESLGTIGTMSMLRRESVGQFSLEDCYKIEELEQGINLVSVSDRIRLKKVECQSFIQHVYHGKRIELDDVVEDCVLLTDQGQAIAVYEREKEKQFKNVRGLW